MSNRWQGTVFWSVCMCFVAYDCFAGTRLPDSASYDWSGWLEKSKLPDNSTLFEYTARTFSGSVEGAMLAVSFVPRFNCSMTIFVRLPRTAENDGIAEAVELLIDDELFVIDSVQEDDGEYTVYSLVANETDIEQLLESINLSIRANVLPVEKSQVDRSLSESNTRNNAGDETRAANSGNGINFSLLGSRAVTEAARLQCTLHEPVGFTPE